VQSFAILLKSYRGDLDLAKRLIASFNAFNPESIHLFALVPAEDLELFAGFQSDTITVLSEEPLAHHFTAEPLAGIRPGYINQEIVKLSFWELGLAENYFCVDSDAVFVRPISRDDFMLDETTPFTVLVEDNELKVEPRYYAQHWQGREVHLRRIQELVGINDRRILTCHGHQIFSATVLRSLKTDLMEPRGWDYKDMLAEAPYEFTWYNMWLQKSRVIPIAMREPLVKVFHHEEQQVEYALRGITNEDIARGYVALVVNSNYARSQSKQSTEDTAADTLARYVPVTSLLRAIVIKAGAPLARRFNRG
jgi:hypothetical protein